MSLSSTKKKEGIFRTVYFVRREFFQDLCFISMYSVMNTLYVYTYFYIQKISKLHKLLLLVSKIIVSLQCILNRTKGQFVKRGYEKTLIEK